MADYNSIHTGAAIDAAITKVAGIEAGADVTDTANVTAAGALMDSEVTNLAAVKAFDPTDYATAAQGGLADTAVQPGDDANTLGSGAATDGYVLTADGVGGATWEAASGGGADDYIRTRAGSIQDLFNMADTWNDGTTTFTAIKMNVTDTASSASSLLMDLQVGGASKFSVDKNGALTTTWHQINVLDQHQIGEFYFGSDGNGALLRFGTPNCGIRVGSRNIMYATTTGVIGFVEGIGFGSSYTTRDAVITRDAADTLAMRRSTNAQTFNLYNTYTDASNYERARFQWVGNELRVGTEAAGTGSLRSTGLYIGNVRYQIIGSGFNQFDQNLYMNGADIATSSGANGFKIGTASTQGLGFWGATPSAQPTAVADATDAASVITQLNALLSRMRTIGLIAT